MEMKDCAKLFEKLDYDNQVMADVEKYAEICAWLGEPCSISNNKSIDSCRQLFSNNTSWNSKTNYEKELILKQIAITLKNNTEIISSIEFSRRGIRYSKTKENIIKIVEYFNYYAKWVHFLEDTPWKPKGNKRTYIQNNASLLHFGWATVAALVAGNSVEIIAEDNVATVLIFMASLLQNSGLPANTLNVVSKSFWAEDFPGQDSNAADTTSFGTVMAIYENCDQDSAVDMVIDATCSQNESLPWALKRIIVQETIYKPFLEKLNERLEKLKPVGSSGDQLSPRESDIAELNKLFTSRNIDTSMPLILLENISPYLIKELASREFFTSIVVTQSFRTTKEAVSLINSVSSIALSVWCENQAVSNEISLLAEVNCVWQNLLGHISPSVPFEFKEGSSKTFLGGNQGIFNEMCEKALSFNMPSKTGIKDVNPQKLIKEAGLSDAITKAKKLQLSWEAMGNDKRSNILIKIAAYLNENRDKCISIYGQNIDTSNTEKVLDTSIEYLHFAARLCTESSNECVIADKKISLTVLKPVGVVTVYPAMESLEIFLASVVAVAMHGNAVVYKTNLSSTSEFCTILQNIGLPVVPFGRDDVQGTHGQDYVWILTPNSKISTDDLTTPFLKCSHLYVTQNKDISEMYFCNRKNIWSSFGETFAN